MNFVKWMVFQKEFCIIIFQGNYLTCVQESFEKALAVFLGVEGQVPSLADYMERRHQFYQQYPEHSHIFFEAMIATPEELEADIAPQKAIFLDLNEQVCQKLISESKSYLFGLE